MDIQSKKWYNNKIFLIILFFIFPPLGIYAIVKHKTSVWKKIIYTLLAGIFSIVVIILVVGIFLVDNYKSGMDYYAQKDYIRAYDNFMLVSSDDENYKDAVNKIRELKPKVDSIKNIRKLNEEALVELEENQVNQKIKTDEKKIVKNDIKSQIERELEAIDKGVNIATGNTVESLQMDLVLFGAYWSIIKEGEISDDKEIVELAEKLANKVQHLQKIGFPKLRKKYVDVIKNIMWENDIEVYASDEGRVLNLTGGVFAANRNIKQTQEAINEIVQMFRFKQVRYRWYKGADEFTFYNLNPQKDTETVVFNK